MRIAERTTLARWGSANKFILAVGLGATAIYAWRSWQARKRCFVIPGSRSTIPDEQGHYDMDGVSFDDKCGVVVGSDGQIAAKTKSAHPRLQKLKGKLPRATH